MQDSKILCNFASVKQRRPLPPNVNDLTASDVECVAASMSDVRILSNMIAPWIICGACGVIAGWFIGRSRRYKKKWEDQCKMLSELYGKLGDSSVRIGDLEKEIREYRLLCTCGCRSLKVKVHRSPIVINNTPCGDVSVIGEHGGYYFIVKSFTYDYYDPEDRDFAIREAEELIETIKKA